MRSRCLIAGSYDGWKTDFVQYLKFWLPRLLQGLADGSYHDYEIIEDLTSARWREWPQREADAVRQWCEAWLAACLVRPAKLLDAIMGDHRAAESLSFAIEIGADVLLVLHSAVDAPSPRTLAGVKGIVEEFAPTLIRRQALESDASESGRLKRELARWMLAPATRTQLESVFFQFADVDVDLAETVSTTLEWIEIVRTAYATDPAGWPDWLSPSAAGG